jgi:predicted O-methyltransferase YrrM
VPAPITDLHDVRALVADTGGGTSANRGEELYRFVKEHGFRDCLELGFYQGVGSVYIAAALESNGAGTLTGVDLAETAELKPGAVDLLERAGLSQRVNLVFEDGGYVWFLYRTLREQLRDDRIEPLYDFVFLDGAHTWDVDALAFASVDRLLKPGGWILFDDLDWHPADPDKYDVPDGTRSRAHVQDLWDTLVATDPTYDELRTDGSWGWARKSPSGTPQVRTVVKRDLLGQVRELGRIARSKIRR